MLGRAIFDGVQKCVLLTSKSLLCKLSPVETSALTSQQGGAQISTHSVEAPSSPGSCLSFTPSSPLRPLSICQVFLAALVSQRCLGSLPLRLARGASLLGALFPSFLTEAQQLQRPQLEGPLVFKDAIMAERQCLLVCPYDTLMLSEMSDPQELQEGAAGHRSQPRTEFIKVNHDPCSAGGS